MRNTARCATGHDRPESTVTIAGIRTFPGYGHKCLSSLGTVFEGQTHKRLVVVNNEIGFNEANIKAICSVGASSKSQDKIGYVGEKGIGLANLDLRQITRIVRDGFIAALGQENRHLILMFWDTSSGRLRGRAMSHFIHSK